MLWGKWLPVCLTVLLVACGEAGKIEIALQDLAVNSCPDSGKKGPSISLNDTQNTSTRCYLLIGTAVNPTESVAKNVDVFGKIIDANGTIAVTRRRVGSLASLPAGRSRFSLEVFFPDSAKPPFTLENMKAAGFLNTVDKR